MITEFHEHDSGSAYISVDTQLLGISRSSTNQGWIMPVKFTELLLETFNPVGASGRSQVYIPRAWNKLAVTVRWFKFIRNTKHFKVFVTFSECVLMFGNL